LPLDTYISEEHAAATFRMHIIEIYCMENGHSYLQRRRGAKSKLIGRVDRELRTQTFSRPLQTARWRKNVPPKRNHWYLPILLKCVATKDHNNLNTMKTSDHTKKRH
jgi:hypothetical protein